MNHPIQPIVTDEQGTIRFKANAIVEYLLEHGGIDMNHLARQDFTADDRQHFAQLIGYSVGGYGSLSYATDEVYSAAMLMHEQGATQEQARLQHLEDRIQDLKDALREPMATLFEIHPSDLAK